MDELPTPTIVDGRLGTTLELRMAEFVSNVLPTGFVPPAGWPAGINGTVTWGYLAPGDSTAANRATYLARSCWPSET